MFAAMFYVGYDWNTELIICAFVQCKRNKWLFDIDTKCGGWNFRKKKDKKAIQKGVIDMLHRDQTGARSLLHFKRQIL